MQQQDLDNRFAYHVPKTDRTKDSHQQVREVLRKATGDVLKLFPDGCRESSVFVTKMEEAMFWANAGLARNQ